MAHPIVFYPKPFFYAIGNTPPVCLTACLPPEEAANVLLLGCGDPRSILFTIFSAGRDATRELDFTCCDIDTAVLARNVVLLTLLADSTRQQMIWKIFYDLYLDDDALSLLSSHCQALCKTSGTIDRWNSGRYGFFLRMCTAETLSALRGHWRLYAKFRGMTSPQKEQFKARYVKQKEEARLMRKRVMHKMAEISKAGPLWVDLYGSDNYWDTGLTLDPTKVSVADMMPNPMFAYSPRGEEFALHYGTHPALCFRVDAQYALASPGEGTGGIALEPDEAESTMRRAKAQFNEWCDSFRARIHSKKYKKSKLTIRLFAGDMMAFCKTLELFGSLGQKTAGLYAAPWKLSELMLDGGGYDENAPRHAPSFFNVIDTSNLVDHLGLLNVLLCAAPLLSQTPSSTLYTETFSRPDSISDFTDQLHGGIVLMSALFGIVPSEYISRFTTASNHYRQGHGRLAWKIPYSCDNATATGNINVALEFEPEALAEFLVQVYRKMFWAEDPTALVKHLVHFSRESFVHFLALVKKKSPTTEWAQTMEKVLDTLWPDRQTSSMNYQEFILHLYKHQVYDSPIRTQDSTVLAVDRSIGRFGSWRTVPPVVCVTLVVPRQALEHLFEEERSSPLLMCEISIGENHNCFSSLHPAFATVRGSWNRKVELVEDPTGRFGNSTLTVSFWAPSMLLLANPESALLKLSVAPTVQATPFIARLGPDLTLFEARLKDEKHVLLSEEFPMISKTPAPTCRPPVSLRLPSAVDTFNLSPNLVSLDITQKVTEVTTLGVKVDVIDPVLKAQLASGTAVTISQHSPCTVNVGLGSTMKLVPFIYPIDQNRAKTRICRQSSCVEILAPPSDLVQTAASPSNCFPIRINDKYPSLWNMHYVSLDSLPRLELSDPQELDWLNRHIEGMLSPTERAICDKRVRSSELERFLPDIKRSLTLITYHFVDARLSRRDRLICLNDPSNGGVYALIFTTDIRLDPIAHTVVLDACVLPLTMPLLRHVLPFVATTIEDIASINTDSLERDAWQHLLPAFTERCRIWKHLDNCAYLKKGIPVSKVLGETPLCDCAPGHASPGFQGEPRFRPLSKYVTRAAISPLFAPSYLEKVLPKPMSHRGGWLSRLRSWSWGRGFGTLQRSVGTRFNPWWGISCAVLVTINAHLRETPSWGFSGSTGGRRANSSRRPWSHVSRSMSHCIPQRSKFNQPRYVMARDCSPPYVRRRHGVINGSLWGRPYGTDESSGCLVGAGQPERCAV